MSIILCVSPSSRGSWSSASSLSSKTSQSTSPTTKKSSPWPVHVHDPVRVSLLHGFPSVQAHRSPNHWTHLLHSIITIVIIITVTTTTTITTITTTTIIITTIIMMVNQSTVRTNRFSIPLGFSPSGKTTTWLLIWWSVWFVIMMIMMIIMMIIIMFIIMIIIMSN